jgi:hypothetical protein
MTYFHKVEKHIGNVAYHAKSLSVFKKENKQAKLNLGVQ